MKRSIIILSLLASTLVACNSNTTGNTKTGTTTTQHKKGKYVCTMHPDITSDKPGVCSKCGMELVERDTTGDK